MCWLSRDCVSRRREGLSNHRGHFLLTALLLDRLLASPAGRVVMTGSSAHRHVDGEEEWCLPRERWDRRVAYGMSKLANLVFARELARRLHSTAVTVYAADPGTPLTRFARNNGWRAWLKHVVYHASRGELTRARAAGHLLAQLALEQGGDGESGQYRGVRGEVEPSAASRDPQVATGLWNLSLQLTGLDERIGPVWNYLRPGGAGGGFDNN